MNQAAQLEISRLDTASADFGERLDALLAWESVSDAAVQQSVAEIVQAVCNRR
jgi:histidinol dehydrogenase